MAKPRGWLLFARAVAYWQAQGLPLAVLLRHAGRTTPETSWL
jgi:hypothetical protein